MTAQQQWLGKPPARDPSTRMLLPLRQVGFLPQIWLKRTQSDSCLPSQFPNKTFQILSTELKLSFSLIT